MSKYLDSNCLLYLWGKIKNLVSGKVDKVDGKGLSTVDFTDANAAKLNNLIYLDTPGYFGGTQEQLQDAISNGYMSAVSKVQSVSTPGLWYLYSATDYATAEKAGIVKAGEGLSINAQGVLSVTGGGTADSVDWSNIQNKPDVALKSDLSTVYRYKGSVTNYASLPTEDNAVGDVWNVEASGMNYAWDGEKWDALGESVTIESITNAEIDTIVAG